jgi:hypothetical protein
MTTTPACKLGNARFEQPLVKRNQYQALGGIGEQSIWRSFRWSGEEICFMAPDMSDSEVECSHEV